MGRPVFGSLGIWWAGVRGVLALCVYSRCFGNLYRGSCRPEATQQAEHPGQCWCSRGHAGQRAGAQRPPLTAGRGLAGSEQLRCWDEGKADGCQRPSSKSPGRGSLTF